MSNFVRYVALAFAVVLSSCTYSAYEDLACTTDAQCGVAGTCIDGYCVAEGGSAVTPTTIEVTPASLDLVPGDTATVEAVVFDGEGNTIADATVVWSSDAESVATVTSDGVVTAVADGTTTIRAVSGNLEATVSVAVATPVASVALDPESLELPIGVSRAITATPLDAGGNPLIGRDAIFASLDDSIATVDDSGLVLGRAEGTTTISVTIEDVMATASVTVTPVVPTAVEISEKPATISFNERFIFGFVITDEMGNVLDASAIGADISWSADPNPTGNSFSQRPDGTFRYLPSEDEDAAGTYELTVTATVDAIVLTDQHTFEVVIPEVSTVTTDPATTATLGVGETRAITVDATDENGATVYKPDPVFSSSNDDVATVDQDGVIEAVGPGTATITISVGGVEATIEVTVEFQLTSISAGHDHACGLDANGVAWCWGDNSNRQLGDGSNSDRSLPVRVNTSETFTQIVAGQRVTCALTAAGDAFCWGDPTRVGDDDGGGDVDTPKAVATNETFKTLSAAYRHVCGITSMDQLYCWGRGDDGELGDGNESSSDAPVLVPNPQGVTGWASVAVGDAHTCAVADTNQLYCWGLNGASQLGDDSTTLRPTPVEASTTEAFGQLSLGTATSCGLVGMTAYCWGDDGDSQTGTGLGGTVGVPTVVQGGLSFTLLEMGSEHVCATDATTSEVYCWGRFDDDRLGTGATDDVATPTAVSPAFVANDLSLGDDFSCATDAMDRPHCWGFNDRGQVGGGNETTASEPRLVWPAP